MEVWSSQSNKRIKKDVLDFSEYFYGNTGKGRVEGKQITAANTLVLLM